MRWRLQPKIIYFIYTFDSRGRMRLPLRGCRGGLHIHINRRGYSCHGRLADLSLVVWLQTCNHTVRASSTTHPNEYIHLLSTRDPHARSAHYGHKKVNLNSRFVTRFYELKNICFKLGLDISAIYIYSATNIYILN